MKWRISDRYQTGKADCHHTKPGNIRLPYLAGAEPVKSHLQGQRRHNHGELRHDPFLRRQGENHAQRNVGALGKETIDLYNTSENRGREKTYGLNYQKLGKELMSQDEIAVMDGGKCILQVRGARPFFSDKFDITKHPRYKFLSPT